MHYCGGPRKFEPEYPDADLGIENWLAATAGDFALQRITTRPRRINTVFADGHSTSNTFNICESQNQVATASFT